MNAADRRRRRELAWVVGTSAACVVLVVTCLRTLVVGPTSVATQLVASGLIAFVHGAFLGRLASLRT